MTRRIIALCALAMMVGCAGKPKRETPPPSKHETLDRTARRAFALGQYAQAATLYQAVLREALAEDAPHAIIDARFNLALCQTYMGNYQSALTELDRAEGERTRRRLGDDPQLQLLAGTIHYRAGDIDRAQTEIDTVLKDKRTMPATRDKAHFVAGLITAEQGSGAKLRTHIAALPADNGAVQADRLELQGHLAGLEGNTDQALHLLSRVARLRRTERDYRGMVRVLASAGRLAAAAGRIEDAAGYLLRAGRSAAQRGEPQARHWLVSAKELGQRSGDDNLVGEAEAVLDALDNKH